jgi:DNA (cytosine-5)-methyltransferase 1
MFLLTCCQRHLYLTNDVDKIPVADIIRKIFVATPDVLSDLETWRSVSPAHFYIRYRFPSIKNRSWRDDYISVGAAEIPHCERCFGDNQKEVLAVSKYVSKLEKSPLKALDLFAGTGAFGFGMEKSCPIKVTHAIEIAPSAARSIKWVNMLSL